ncbi:hypothetical protein VP01_548g5 [Puccinia sorghi]|uniref:Uncharacterized protein n=1 Tax=Puccinia sorghi TaxID=27349 RepID=A0A0L6UJF9_9BASI|nr:hypothetical protein VP01_548g5 [Puccinia sorghi]
MSSQSSTAGLPHFHRHCCTHPLYTFFFSKVPKAQRFFRYLMKTMASKFLPKHLHKTEKNHHLKKGGNFCGCNNRFITELLEMFLSRQHTIIAFPFGVVNGASKNLILPKWILFPWIQLFELPSSPHIQKGLIPRRFKLKFQKKQTLMSAPAHGNIFLDEFYKAVDHTRRFLLHNNTGYQRMRRKYSIKIPFHATCLQHNKRNLKKFGIIDALSRNILGMFFHVTKNNPQQIGVYFLHHECLSSLSGGTPLFAVTTSGSFFKELGPRLCVIPQNVMSDYVYETVGMATLKIDLLHQHGAVNFKQLKIKEASKQMHFTKSTHNQRIESLWSQMMKQHNFSIINKVLTQICLQLTCSILQQSCHPNSKFFAYVDVLATSLCSWSNNRSFLGVSACQLQVVDQFSLSNPAWMFVLVLKIIIKIRETIPYQLQLLGLHNLHTVLQNILLLLQCEYPDIEAIFTHTPGMFHEVSHVFPCILPIIQLNFQEHEYTDLSLQHSEYIKAS